MNYRERSLFRESIDKTNRFRRTNNISEFPSYLLDKEEYMFDEEKIF